MTLDQNVDRSLAIGGDEDYGRPCDDASVNLFFRLNDGSGDGTWSLLVLVGEGHAFFVGECLETFDSEGDHRSEIDVCCIVFSNIHVQPELRSLLVHWSPLPAFPRPRPRKKIRYHMVSPWKPLDLEVELTRRDGEPLHDAPFSVFCAHEPLK